MTPEYRHGFLDTGESELLADGPLNGAAAVVVAAGVAMAADPAAAAD